MDLSAPISVLLLAFAPAVMWGFTPVIEKRALSEGGGPLQASLVVVLVDSAIYLAALAVFQDDPFGGITLGTIGIFVAAGAVGTALGRLAIFAGNARVGASISSAVVSSRPLFATALAIGFLGEPLSAPTAIGIFILVIGLGVLSVAKGGDLEGWSNRDLLVPLAAAAFFALGNVARRWGLATGEATPLEAVAINEFAALLTLGAYVAVAGRGTVLNRPRRSYLVFAASGVITSVALLSMFTALAAPAGRIAVVDPLVATAPLFTVIFSWIWLGDLERVTRGVVVGVLLVVFGAALVTGGPSLVRGLGALGF
ncbi:MULTISPECIES: DMT family transporter [Haloferax]|uniref:EamA family transporter n=2 Tax=Haloferax TaxID=2251 RepID=A0A6G1Z695_9EURY|nr:MULTISPECIES: DMT family transporter [Haloferax]KAB1185433.1 DMT family transporter [Haloferax sp. CBA1149]MRW82080.1 EamA family transporter [Haloferax marinisediminis]